MRIAARIRSRTPGYGPPRRIATSLGSGQQSLTGFASAVTEPSPVRTPNSGSFGSPFLSRISKFPDHKSTFQPGFFPFHRFLAYFRSLFARIPPVAPWKSLPSCPKMTFPEIPERRMHTSQESSFTSRLRKKTRENCESRLWQPRSFSADLGFLEWQARLFECGFHFKFFIGDCTSLF